MNWLSTTLVIILVLIILLQQTQIMGLTNYVNEIDQIVARIVIAAKIQKEMGIEEQEDIC